MNWSQKRSDIGLVWELLAPVYGLLTDDVKSVSNLVRSSDWST